jgi:hypothetical protein
VKTTRHSLHDHLVKGMQPTWREHILAMSQGRQFLMSDQRQEGSRRVLPLCSEFQLGDARKVVTFDEGRTDVALSRRPVKLTATTYGLSCPFGSFDSVGRGPP